jgi:hypothetical protein
MRRAVRIPKPELKAIATKIQETGKDATVQAVLREVKAEQIKQKREAYESRTEEAI